MPKAALSHPIPPPRRRTGRVITVLGAIIAVLTISASVAFASSQLGSLIEVDYASDDMNSTAVETSGATYNGSTHSLFTVDDEHNAYEFALDADGVIDQSVTPRIIELNMGRDDFEGVAWLTGQTYAFLSEGDGQIVIATVPEADTNGETTIGLGDVVESFQVISGVWGNLGPEGLATDSESFFMVREMPATLTKFGIDGQFEASVDLSSDLADASGVAALQDGTFLVISHESRVVAHYDVDWEFETASLLATRDASTFSQLEGIAVMNGTDVYLFGEDNTRKGQPGQTYSHLQGDLFPGGTNGSNGGDGGVGDPSYAVSDVDCSGTIDLSDAIIIARFEVGIAELMTGCGTGDHNDNGVVDIGDALMIAQCTVGIANVGCLDA